MALPLYRLGRFSFRHRRFVAFAWLLALVAGGVGAATLAGTTSNAFSIPGTQSQRAIDLLVERFPRSGVDGATARVVFTAPPGATLRDGPPKAAIERVVRELAGAPKVGVVVGPYEADAISPDGRTAYAQVAYTVQAGDILPAEQDALKERARPARDAGLGVNFGGDATEEQQEQSLTEIIGVVMAGFVLILTLGSLVAAGLPLLNALVGVSLGMMGVQIATGFFDLSSSSSTLALMLGLAVSVDYALFIVTRYRHEVALGRVGEDAAGRAIGTAGSAVVFAGLTVVIALSALSVVGIPFLTAMGLAAAGTVVVAVVIALTLLPAMLGFAGRRVLGIKKNGEPKRTRRTRDPERSRLGARWVGLTLRHRIPAVLGCVVVLGVLAIPALDLRLGMPGEDTRPVESTQRQAYEALSKGFGPGFNGPLLIAVENETGGKELPGSALDDTRDRLGKVSGVVAVTDARLNQEKNTAIITVVPATGPTDAATNTLVNTIRADADEIARDTGLRIAVTGATAIGIDVADKLNRALVPYLIVVVGLACLLLLLVFRSILMPIKATLGFLLSVVATFGAVVAIFQWGWLAEPLNIASKGPIVSFLPIFLIGLLFGLAMDYEVFLVTRMREEFVHGASAERSIVLGFEHGARVVTAAAVIMISVFGGFMLAPEPIIQSIGFALAFGVLVDAFVVRMTLVPALLSLMGARAWWLPKWLDRVLPDVDVEGEKLRARLDGPLGAPAPPVPVPVAPGSVAPVAVAVAVAAPAVESAPPPVGPAVRGRITAVGGGVVPGAVVTVIDTDGRQVGRCPAGPYGSYSVAVPGERTYVVLGGAPDRDPVVAAVAVNGVPVGHDVELHLSRLPRAGAIPHASGEQRPVTGASPDARGGART